jgi:hypothetical protein
LAARTSEGGHHGYRPTLYVFQREVKIIADAFQAAATAAAPSAFAVEFLIKVK